MSDINDPLLEHEYDGIKEYDNPLPSWWLWLFILSIVWSIGYVPYFHFGPGQLPSELWRADMQAYLQQHPPVTLPDLETLEAIGEDPSQVAAGKAVYDVRCMSCHAADGGGLVGPNLTDDFALHGWGMEPIARTILEGVPDKGMQAWKSTLSLDEILAVAAYVKSLRGTKPATPKAAEGEPIAAAAAG
jgi:cytochrome c oxidase cbb3-type subunit 3